MEVGKNKLIFSSGKELKVEHNVVGLNPDLDIFEGSDGYLDWVDEYDPEPDNLTKEERNELADYMIDLWTQYKNKK